MKNFKKFAGILLALIMVLSMATAFAAEEKNGSITITNTTGEATYNIYKMLDLVYDQANNAYSYTVNTNWASFMATDEAKAFLTVDEGGFVEWTGSKADADVAKFAQDALAYAKANNVPFTKTSDPEVADTDVVLTDTTLVFSNLELGYYLIDSTVGVLCGLTTTDPNGHVAAKNHAPTVDKQVEEDDGETWGDMNHASIGETVNFRVKIDVHKGAQNYVLHDVMSEGLTFTGITSIKHRTSENQETEVPAEFYNVVTEGLTDECTFEVRFTEEFCNHISATDSIYVFYSAIVNEKAKVANEHKDENGNPNSTGITYGEGHETTWDETNTYTFGFDLVKTDNQDRLLNGAKFRLYDAATGGNEILLVKNTDGTYRKAMEGELEGEQGDEIEVTDGKVRIVGFDKGTYYLEETVAPVGFNKLSNRVAVLIDAKSVFATFENGVYTPATGVQIENNTGTELPSTGGMGTTLFYVFGGIMVAAAVVLLVTKKRMNVR